MVRMIGLLQSLSHDSRRMRIYKTLLLDIVLYIVLYT